MNMLRLIYIYLAACLFVACQSGFDEPVPEPVVNANPELISITVSEEILSNDGSNSRAADVGAITSFEKGDRVGLIILDKDDNYVVRNVPYIYDGNKWAFDSVGAGGKPCPFYEKTMSSYIVYFPYVADADNITSADEIKDLEVFRVREDQSSDEDYLFSDPMTFSYSGASKKQLDVTLRHCRNSFALDSRVKFELTNGEKLHYHPKEFVYEGDVPVKVTSAYEQFVIRLDGKYLKNSSDDKSQERNYMNIAKDGSYRYILEDDYSGTFTWRYYYRGLTYGGECTVNGDKKGMRYLQDEYIDLGKLEGESVEPGDFFLKKNGIGFTFPWDAAIECLEDPTQCIGIVIYNKQHQTDRFSTYPEEIYEGTYTAESHKCHGYVVALTDAHGNNMGDQLRWKNTESLIEDSRKDCHTIHNDAYWTGYSNQVGIKGFAMNEGLDFATMFPAANACEIYGNNPKCPWQDGLTAPANTSGWYLPSWMELNHVYNLNGSKSRFAQRIRLIKALLPDDCAYKEYVVADYSLQPHGSQAEKVYHWSSNEYASQIYINGVATNVYTLAYATSISTGESDHVEKTKLLCVRAVLAY